MKVRSRRGRAFLGTLMSAALAATIAGCSPSQSSRPLFNPKDECPNLEKLGVFQSPYTSAQLGTILSTLGTTADTTDSKLNSDIEAAYHTANSLKRLVDADQHSFGELPSQLDNGLFAISDDCSRLVGG